MKHKKPKILISKCLEFDACRYDGQRITNIYIQKLKQHVDFIVICPEVEIGLGVPREPIHIINSNEKISLYQPKTDIDITEKMIRFSKKYISSIKNIDGIILKSKSPSCAINTAKHYPSIDSNKSICRGPGLFSNILIMCGSPSLTLLTLLHFIPASFKILLVPDVAHISNPN